VEECDSFAVDTDLKGYVGTPTTIAAHAPPDIPPDPPVVSWGDEGEAADPGVTVFIGDHQVQSHHGSNPGPPNNYFTLQLCEFSMQGQVVLQWWREVWNMFIPWKCLGLMTCRLKSHDERGRCVTAKVKEKE
jgi:hypothetical protein